MGKAVAVQVTLTDATTRLGELISRALQGDEIIISKEGTPLVRLAPLVPLDQPRLPGLDPGAAQTSEDFDAELPEEFWLGTA